MAIRVEDAMQTKVRTVGPDLLLPELERAFVSARVGAFPVVRDGRLVGLVSRSDLVRRLVLDQSLEDYRSDFYVDLTGFDERDPHESLESIATRAGARIEGLTVERVMTRATVTATPDMTLQEAARLMHDHHIHRVPVTRDEELVGILSASDIVALVAEGQLGAP